ncbi:molybdate ABC transporter substrate-binding protein [Corynebacterium uberis]|uniref:molybdate ABC transporter substrate-binding protein n=1 Tax=Corynebacterium TaxID=1716 RepID=UPI001D09CC7D|nr:MULTISPECIES: molybdate ABC transporter substrate-binding protein [Corynebacterium]MCZ9309005.1 molybdate ABC transporter substrate-binding protein [Corynebacterium sp. c6VSa_13]UDL74527.1 molybdate ABC transporter substrate-binding protein [Corynebacterium uberis]UDL76639.1 molybdate ABC transporter substrate-binding protein [Corynebacterium uberis]UDL78852.1 molybdate ABC transporter substrate-binding protein [Corynebacterium uberis]UDL83269.1 molybdate ABC transporter substrate-binding p
MNLRTVRTLGAVALAAAAGLALAACSPQTESATSADGEKVNLQVLAAASTRVLNDDLTATFDQAHLEFHNAGSSTLVQQLRDGSPGDVFISADQKNMDKAVSAGVVDTPVTVATNSMVMVVPKGNPAHVTGVDSSLDHAKLVLCDKQVPCGAVSADIQKDLGIELSPASLEQSVSDVLGKVTSGEADAGWVYRTDAAAAGDKVEVIDIPHAAEHENSLVAAVTSTTEHREQAQALVDLLASPQFAQVWRNFGFTPAA